MLVVSRAARSEDTGAAHTVVGVQTEEQRMSLRAIPLAIGAAACSGAHAV